MEAQDAFGLEFKEPRGSAPVGTPRQSHQTFHPTMRMLVREKSHLDQRQYRTPPPFGEFSSFAYVCH